MTSNINVSCQLILFGSVENIYLVDPQTSYVLQNYKIVSQRQSLFCQDNRLGYVLTCSPDKNFMVAYDFKGGELWKQNVCGQAVLIEIITFNDIVLGFHKNKEVRIWSQIWEKKAEIQIDSNEIESVRYCKNFVAVSEGFTFQIYIFAIEDILAGNGISNELIKPIKKLSGHSNYVNDFCFGKCNRSIFYSVGRDNQYLVWNISQDQKPMLQGLLDSEPKCITNDLSDEYIFIGCTNKNIYQFKLETSSQTYAYDQQRLQTGELRLERDNLKKKTLVGHQGEVLSLNFYINDDGNGILISGSADGILLGNYQIQGQLFFWNIFGSNNKQMNPTILKKITSLSNRQITKILVIERPSEYKYESDEQTFFKFKRMLTLKPLKKQNQEDKEYQYQTLYKQSQQVLIKVKQVKGMNKKIELKRSIKAYKLQNITSTIQTTSVQSIQINDVLLEKQLKEIIEENKKLKQFNVFVMNQYLQKQL